MVIKDPQPISAFLSIEKDMNLIVEMMFRNNRLKKLLHHTTRDALDRPNLTQDETLELFGKNIKLVPKMEIDETVLNYLFINFNDFIPNKTNPEFRDNIIEFDILCHFNQWHLKDFELRPYKIAAEIDSMFNKKHLTGIGLLEFVCATQISENDEFGGLCLVYRAIHGEEDKKPLPNPEDQVKFVQNFKEMYNK